MAKWHGVIGYAETKETRPGIYEEVITEHSYTGNVLENTRRLQSSGQVNDDVEITMQISILADPIARMNFHNIRYVSYMGTKWKASSIRPRFPRLIMTLGGVYNGPQA